nr:MAG TPA: hypothetical protein [Caudoviricetes sp.]
MRASQEEYRYFIRFFASADTCRCFYYAMTRGGDYAKTQEP